MPPILYESDYTASIPLCQITFDPAATRASFRSTRICERRQVCWTLIGERNSRLPLRSLLERSWSHSDARRREGPQAAERDSRQSSNFTAHQRDRADSYDDSPSRNFMRMRAFALLRFDSGDERRGVNRSPRGMSRSQPLFTSGAIEERRGALLAAIRYYENGTEHDRAAQTWQFAVCPIRFLLH